MALLLSLKRTVDLEPGLTTPQVFHVSQNDVGTRLYVALEQGGTAYTIPDGTTAKVQGCNALGEPFEAITATVSASEVYFTITDQDVTQFAGNAKCEVVLTNGTNILGTANFIVAVEASPMGSDVPAIYTNPVQAYIEGVVQDYVDDDVLPGVTAAINSKADASDVGDLTELETVDKSSIVDAINELVDLKTDIIGIDNSLSNKQERIEYDYLKHVNLSPSTSSTEASAVGIKRDLTLFELNTVNTITRETKIKINGDIIRTNSNTTVNAWNGVPLISGHLYEVAVTYVSGTASISPDVVVYPEGTHATIGIKRTSGNSHSRIFTYSGAPVVLGLYVGVDSTFDAYTVNIILKDISVSVYEQNAVNANKYNAALNLVNYGYDTGEIVKATTYYPDLIRNKTSVLISDFTFPRLTFIKASGEFKAESLAADVKNWDDGITLKAGTRYTAKLKKISGESSNQITLSVYKLGQSSTIGQGKTIDDTLYIRSFVAPETAINIVIYIPLGTVTQNCSYSLVLEEDVEYPTAESWFQYSGERINVQNEIACEQYMRLKSGIVPQGTACYDKYLFVASDTLPSLNIYDLETATNIADITFEPVSTYHCNNINFGTEKYAENDYFPLLYISQENIAEHKCLVYRITMDDTVFTAELVQTITYPDPSVANMYYPNCFLDNLNNLIYLLGYTKSSYSADENRILRVTGYNLPLLSSGDVTLNLNDAIQNFVINTVKTSHQGCIINGDKIIQAYGNPSNIPDIYIGQISLSAERCVTRIRLNELGITTEPESLFVYENHLFIVLANRYVYKLYFNQ